MLGIFTSTVDQLNERLGRAISWLALLMVLLQAIVVVMRYAFGLGSVMLQEAIIYMHATLFMMGASYTLRHDGHVRCDVFFSKATPIRRALIDLGGVFIFLLPMCITILWVSLPYVINAWAVLEGSPEGSQGLPAVFLLKTLIPVTTILLALQGLSMAGHALTLLGNLPPSSSASGR